MLARCVGSLNFSEVGVCYVVKKIDLACRHTKTQDSQVSSCFKFLHAQWIPQSLLINCGVSLCIIVLRFEG